MPMMLPMFNMTTVKGPTDWPISEFVSTGTAPLDCTRQSRLFASTSWGVFVIVGALVFADSKSVFTVMPVLSSR